MRVLLTDTALEVRLSLWEKAFGLLRNIRVPRADIGEVRVVEDPLREAMGSGIKVGLRIPWLYFVARTINLDRAFIVRRGVPALSFDVANKRALRHVLVSTTEASEIVRALHGRQPAGDPMSGT